MIFTREFFWHIRRCTLSVALFLYNEWLYLWRLSSELSIYSVSFHLFLPVYPVVVPDEKSLFIHSIKGTRVELSILLARMSITDFFFAWVKSLSILITYFEYSPFWWAIHCTWGLKSKWRKYGIFRILLFLRCRIIPRNIKIGTYKTLIRPIIFYGAEAHIFSEDIC